MPEVKCENCGRLTNTACSDYDWRRNVATKCYLAFENDMWVKGCGFDIAPLFIQKMYWQKEWGRCPIRKVKKGD